MIKVVNFLEPNDVANIDVNAKPTMLVGDLDTFVSIISGSNKEKNQ